MSEETNLKFRTTAEIFAQFEVERLRRFHGKYEGKIPEHRTEPVEVVEVEKPVMMFDDTEVKEAIKIEERRSYLEWLQENIGKLTPRQQILSGAGALAVLIGGFFSGCP